MAKSPTLELKKSEAYYSKSIQMDVSLDAGHVLVHYLVTGEHQCLEPPVESPAEKNAAEFVTALRVYKASQSFELSQLTDIAEMEIWCLGDQLSLPTVISLMEEASPSPINMVAWGLYLETRIQRFCVTLTRPTADDALIEIGAPDTIGKAILKSMIQTACRDLPDEEGLSAVDELDEETIPEAEPVSRVEAAAKAEAAPEDEIFHEPDHFYEEEPAPPGEDYAVPEPEPTPPEEVPSLEHWPVGRKEGTMDIAVETPPDSPTEPPEKTHRRFPAVVEINEEFLRPIFGNDSAAENDSDTHHDAQDMDGELLLKKVEASLRVLQKMLDEIRGWV